MHMQDKQGIADAQSLEQFFGQMRREDAEQSPEFPDTAMLMRRDPLPLAHSSYSAIPKTAAAIAVLAAFVVLLSREPAQQDPALLYTQVMGANNIATDTLLSVSPGTLPGMTSLPDVYATGLPGDQ